MATSAILVVDSNPATARRFRRALHDTELEVRLASGMADALQQAADHDLVAIFSAISIPGGNGYELTRRVVDHRPSMAVFLLWGGFEPFDEDRAMISGVRAGLRRPFSTETVLGHLEDLMGALPLRSTPLEPEEPAEELLPVGSIEPLDSPPVQVEPSVALPPVGSERLATFVPADYDDIPPVSIDREEVSVGLERAAVAVVPEVLEALLDKALTQPGPMQTLVQRAVARAVAEQLPGALEQALRERLGEDDER